MLKGNGLQYNKLQH